jgi:SAM-dependent methyltransferase
MDAAFKDHFSTRSADYAAFRPTYPPALVDYLAGITARHDLALDCGCGNGQLSTLLAERFTQVIATDASAQQIEKAQRHARVDYRQARAEATGLADASVDLVTVAQAVHWFDLDAFYAEVRRVLRPGGAIVLIAYGVSETDREIKKVIAHYYTDTVGRFWPSERQHVETGYRLLAFPFREETAPPLAIERSWTLDDLVGYVETWSASINAVAALGRAPIEEFAGNLRAVWGPPDFRRTIRWPLSLRVGRI